VVEESRKKQRKVIKSQGKGISLVVGKDVRVEQVVSLLDKTLVGKILGRKMGLDSLNTWIQSHWGSILEKGPTFHLLERGWIRFIFHSEVDAMCILWGQWFFDKVILSLKPWHPGFNAHEEFAKLTLVWVRLPRLPMEFWNDKSLKEIGDILGKFILADNSYKSSNAHFVAKILVDLDVSVGLYESMEIEAGSTKFTQLLDYENIPFRCIRCHLYGHSV
jgi:hypothetical protein